MLSLSFFVFLLCGAPRNSGAQADSALDTFPEASASKLLRQVAGGLQGHSIRSMLSAFDLSRMDGGPVFKQQITAFFNQYDPIRVHFKLVEVKDNVAVVDAEMDISPLNDDGRPERKRTELRFTGGRSAGEWRFIDVQPRSFFS